MHIKVFTKPVFIEVRVGDVNHAGLGECGEHFVRALSHIVCATLQGIGAQLRMKTTVGVPCLVNQHFNALLVGVINNGFQIIVETIVGTGC